MEVKFKAYIKQWDKIVNVYGLCWQNNQLQVEVLENEYDESEEIETDILNDPENFVFFINGKECDLLQYTGSKNEKGEEEYKDLKLIGGIKCVEL